MHVISTTPFGQRPVTAGLIKRAAMRQQAPTLPRVRKWDILRELCAAKKTFGLNDRDIAVLNALVSFHKSEELDQTDQLVVFPSNATLSNRAHGMPESTLRRHIGKLVKSGLILRNDSPNGKRYAMTSRNGDIVQAYGFDLRPLLVRASEIIDAAETQRQKEAERKALRNEIIILKRDADKLIEYSHEIGLKHELDDPKSRLAELAKFLRRKLDVSALTQLKQTLIVLVDKIKEWLGIEQNQTPKMSGNDIQNERHYSNSNKNTAESEQNPVPLPMVLQACPDLQDFADRPLRNWHDFISSMSIIKSMMGITAETWEHAMKIMGPQTTAVVTAGILQRMGEIKSPGGYLRRLTQKAEKKSFSPMPMMVALLRQTS